MLVKLEREWISAGKGLPRIVQAARRTIYGYGRAPGRCKARVDAPLQRKIIVCEPVRGSDRRPAITVHIPSQSDARPKIRPSFVDAGFVWEAGIARVVETRRCVSKHRTLDALSKPFDVEIVDSAVCTHLRKKWLPPQAIVDGYSRNDFPVVLGIQPDKRLLAIKRIGGGLRERV